MRLVPEHATAFDSEPQTIPKMIMDNVGKPPVLAVHSFSAELQPNYWKRPKSSSFSKPHTTWSMELMEPLSYVWVPAQKTINHLQEVIVGYIWLLGIVKLLNRWFERQQECHATPGSEQKLSHQPESQEAWRVLTSAMWHDCYVVSRCHRNTPEPSP